MLDVGFSIKIEYQISTIENRISLYQIGGLMTRKLVCASILLLFSFISTGFGQKNMSLKITATGQILSQFEQSNSLEKDRGICLSNNRIYRGEYTFNNSGFDYFSVKEFRLFKNDSLISIISNLLGVGFYISNSGVVAAVDVTESPAGNGTIIFYSFTGIEIFRMETRHGHAFQFSEDGNWFGVLEKEALRIVQPHEGKSLALNPVDKFDFSENADIVVGYRNGEISIWNRGEDQLQVHSVTAMEFIRKIVVSPDGKKIGLISKNEAKVFSATNPEFVLFQRELESGKRFNDIRLENDRVALGIQEKAGNEMNGLLEIYDYSGRQIEIEKSDLLIIPKNEAARSLKKSSQRDEIAWPFAPFDSVYAIGNSYEEYQNYGGDPYPHPGVDLMAGHYTPVYAVSDGIVKAVLTISANYHWRVAVGDSSGPDRCEGWLYAHLDRGSIVVNEGDVVYAGDYLGQLVPWPSYNFTHLHFVKIEEEGETWTTPWDAVVNALEVMRPNTDDSAPMFFNTINEDKFAFCYNESSIYLPADNLNGNIDIIARVSDFINDDYWQCAVYKLTYWIKHIPSDTLILKPKLAAIMNHRIPDYTATAEFTHTLYKDDFTLDTKGDYNNRIYYHILTNNDGDSLLEESDKNKSFDTTQFPDDPYRIYVQAEDAYGNVSIDSMNVVFNNGITAAENENLEPTQLTTFRLFQNYPNPFNGQTLIGYEVRQAANVRIEIYNLKGQLIRTLVNRSHKTGQFNILWNGRDGGGKKMPSGVYIYALETAGFSEQIKMLLLQ